MERKDQISRRMGKGELRGELRLKCTSLIKVRSCVAVQYRSHRLRPYHFPCQAVDFAAIFPDFCHG